MCKGPGAAMRLMWLARRSGWEKELRSKRGHVNSGRVAAVGAREAAVVKAELRIADSLDVCV